MENTIAIRRFNPQQNYQNLLAFADVKVNGVVINGVRLVEGKNGAFVSMPQRQGKNGRYFPICNIEDTDLRTELLTLLNDELAAYQQ